MDKENKNILIGFIIAFLLFVLPFILLLLFFIFFTVINEYPGIPIVS